MKFRSLSLVLNANRQIHTQNIGRRKSQEIGRDLEQSQK